MIPKAWLYVVPTTPFGRVRASVNDPVPDVMVRLIGPVVLCCGLDASVTLRVM